MKKKMNVNDIKGDVLPELEEYFSIKYRICGGKDNFFKHYIDDPFFATSADLAETLMRLLVSISTNKTDLEKIYVKSLPMKVSSLVRERKIRLDNM